MSSPGAAGARKGHPKPGEFSAGGVVLRDAGSQPDATSGVEVMVIVPRRRGADGRRVLGLPKGHIDGDETPEQAAAREVREEAGVEGDLLCKVGDARYWYQRGGRRIFKVVSFFLFAYTSGDPEDHDDEVEEARWMPVESAEQQLSHAGEREMLALALERWREGSSA